MELCASFDRKQINRNILSCNEYSESPQDQVIIETQSYDFNSKTDNFRDSQTFVRFKV